jgi:hypothetical protein
MQPLPAPDQSVQGVPVVHDAALSSTGPRLSETNQFASRWEPDTLDAHVRYTDPYAAWLTELGCERYPATESTARRATRRFGRNRSPKAPWETIPVRLSPDNR